MGADTGVAEDELAHRPATRIDRALGSERTADSRSESHAITDSHRYGPTAIPASRILLADIAACSSETGRKPAPAHKLAQHDKSG